MDNVTNLNIPLGALRGGHSPDHQYAPQAYNPGDVSNVGVVRDIKSSSDSISVLEAIVSPRPLVESDAPSLIPRQMSKYLRYYTLYKAFGVTNEGHRPDLSEHYKERFDRGVLLMAYLTAPTARSRNYVRENAITTGGARQQLRIRLPSAYPRVDWR